LDLGVVINLDNEYEMEIVDELIKAQGLSCPVTKGRVQVIGLRINPAFEQGGKIEANNTSVRESKFGLPLVEETKERMIDLFRKYDWLNGVHFHVGSQGNPLKLFVNAARIIMGFVNDVERCCDKKIHTIDIGGGLSTDFENGPEPKGFEFTTYRRELEKAAPDLFSGRYQIVTEMGGSLIQKAGKTLVRIETVKNWLSDVRPILLTHVGANQFPFEVYLPEDSGHRFDIVCPDSGRVKRGGPKKAYDIAGCLCFQVPTSQLRQQLPVSAASSAGGLGRCPWKAS